MTELELRCKHCGRFIPHSQLKQLSLVTDAQIESVRNGTILRLCLAMLQKNNYDTHFLKRQSKIQFDIINIEATAQKLV